MTQAIFTFLEYQRRARETAIYPEGKRIIYPVIGLQGEVGELSGLLAKVIRDKAGMIDIHTKSQLAAEIGDVLWFLSALATDLDLDLAQIAVLNLNKLEDRRMRGVLNGSGDHR